MKISLKKATALLLLVISSVCSQWTVQNYDTTYTLGSITFINTNTGFAGGEQWGKNFTYKGVIFRTTNAGNNWNIVFLDTNLIIYNIHFIDNITGYAVGGLYSNQPKIVKTTNTGNTWFYDSPNGIEQKISSFKFFGNVIYATCVNNLYKSSNNGANWNAILNYSYSYYCCSYFTDINSGWCAGGLGYVSKTTNGGISWDTTVLDYVNPHSIQFVNSLTGFLVCDSSIVHQRSMLFKTTNGGLNWVMINTGFTGHLWAINFINENTGYLSGGFSNILKTTNSGTNWVVLMTSVQEEFIGLHFFDSNTGYACGSNSTIAKTTTGGVISISPISSEIPRDYMLLQNYPNPFNPLTNIKFALPKAAFVKLAVYDMLGREVEQLVNQQLTPGTYQVDWNAVKFSSGIYLYRLVTDDFSMVKKMSLIK